MTDYRANTLSDFLRIAKEIKDRFNFETSDPWGPWFRGHANAHWHLLPKLYREYGGFKSVKSRKIEDEMREEFIIRAPILCENLPHDDEVRAEWQWYSTMQHFGAPTRLLDWTDGSLIALYFAVKDNMGFFDAAVWVLDPWELNLRGLSKKVIKRGWVLPPSAPGLGDSIRKELKRWLPDRFTNLRGLPDKTIAIYPEHTERRISTQRSGFTIHGKNEKDLDDLFSGASKYLIKITIPARDVQFMKRELDAAGIDEVTVFPDLTGLARVIGARWKPDGHPNPHLKVFTRLGQSKIHGVGVFAIASIKKGTPIFDGENLEMPWFEDKQVLKTPAKIRRLYKDFGVVKHDDPGWRGCPTSFNRLNPSWFLNEARNGKKPNVECNPETFEFRALRDIKLGEELLVAYEAYSI
jgi:FRG domain